MAIRDRLRGLSERQWLLLLLVMAMATRLGWAVLMSERQPYADEMAYIGHATSLAQGEGYVNERGQSVAFWPPGYPLALAAVYRTMGIGGKTSVAFQIAVSTVTCILLYLLGKGVFSVDVARLASLGLALYPNHLFYSTLRLTEPLFTLLLVSAVVLLLRSLDRRLWHAMAAGGLLGLAALTRPVIILFPLLLPAWYMWNGRRWHRALTIALLVCAATLATVSPWLVRNHGVTGRWSVISTTGAYNFWIGNNAKAMGGYAVHKSIKESLYYDKNSPLHHGYHLGLKAITAEPGKALLRAVGKLTYLFALETDGTMWNLKGFDPPLPLKWTLLLLLLANSFYVVLLATGTLTLLASDQCPPFRSLFLLLLGYTACMAFIFIGDPRYHFHLMPFMLLFGAQGILEEWPKMREGLHSKTAGAGRRLVVWGTVMTLMGLVMGINLVLKYFESRLL
jgi:4-amino-4-deoxy-L-arabinose transferase-like glycosyltransferase